MFSTKEIRLKENVRDTGNETCIVALLAISQETKFKIETYKKKKYINILLKTYTIIFFYLFYQLQLWVFSPRKSDKKLKLTVNKESKTKFI